MKTQRKSRRVQRRAPRACSACRRCGGKGTVTTYFDAGDHFSAGPAPDSGWRTYTCPECKGEQSDNSRKQQNIKSS